MFSVRSSWLVLFDLGKVSRTTRSFIIMNWVSIFNCWMENQCSTSLIRIVHFRMQFSSKTNHPKVFGSPLLNVGPQSISVYPKCSELIKKPRSIERSLRHYVTAMESRCNTAVWNIIIPLRKGNASTHPYEECINF